MRAYTFSKFVDGTTEYQPKVLQFGQRNENWWVPIMAWLPVHFSQGLGEILESKGLPEAAATARALGSLSCSSQRNYPKPNGLSLFQLVFIQFQNTTEIRFFICDQGFLISF